MGPQHIESLRGVLRGLTSLTGRGTNIFVWSLALALPISQSNTIGIRFQGVASGAGSRACSTASGGNLGLPEVCNPLRPMTYEKKSIIDHSGCTIV